MNEAGGVDGRPFFLDVRDSHSDVAKGTATAFELLGGEAMSFFIGPEEPAIAIAITSTIKEHQMVDLMPGLTSPLFHDPSSRAAWFRLSPSLNYLACGLAKGMRSNGVGKAAVVIDPDDYSTGFATVFGRVFGDHGGTVLPALHVSSDKSSFASILTVLDGFAADAAILLTSPSVAADFLQEWAVRGKHGDWYLGPTLHDPELLVNVAAGILEGIHGVSPDLGSHSDAFAAFFQARTGIAPTAGSHYYFDAVALLGLTLAEGFAHDGLLPTPTLFKQHLSNVTQDSGQVMAFDAIGPALDLLRGGQPVQYDGAAGLYFLDSYGDTIENRAAIWRIQGAEFVNVDYHECAESEVRSIHD
jgi:neutral amino acid transport system substrate-binding protein